MRYSLKRPGACLAMLPVVASSMVFAAQQADKSSIVKGELGAKIDEYLRRLVPFGFSGALVVAKDGDVVLRAGYGLADRKTGARVTPDTVFTIGSITKQFTGAAILKLEMQGKLSVNDPITKYFDNVPEDKAGITLHHLLTHTAGLVDGLGDDFDLRATRDWVFEEAMKSDLRWKPGTRHAYSNLGFSLLGMIVEKASGQSYESFLREHLFKPAGMTRTGYLLPKYRDEELAVGYRDGERWGIVIERPMLEDGPCWNLRANGGIHSTVGDMYRWHLALESDRILSPEAKEKLFTPHVPEGPGADSFYGYGWAIFTTQRGTKLIAHNGGNMIFSADFRRYVDENVMFFVTSSVSEFFIDDVSSRVARVIFGYPYKLPPEVVELGPATLTQHTGTYRLESGAEFEVRGVDKGLAFSPHGQEAFGLLASGRTISVERAGTLNDRTARIIERGAKGDYAPLQEAFGDQVPPDEVAEMARTDLAQREERLGKFKSVEVLGSGPYRMGMTATTVRVNFERGSDYLRFGWGHRHLMGIRPLSGPPRFRFLPQSATAFILFKLGSPEPVRVSFAAGADGVADTLTFRTPSGKIAATKVH